METATVILSFDCEGKWGIADRSSSRINSIEQNALRQAYKSIITLQKKYGISATFAFVAALCMQDSELIDWLKQTQTLKYQGKNWLTPAIAQLTSGISEGWCDPTLLSLVRDAGNHEICSHGGTHLPYSEEFTSNEDVLADLDLSRSVFSQLGIPLHNIIFPRNIIGYKNLIAKAGYQGYRNIDSWEMKKGRSGKLSRLAAEFIALDKSSLPTSDSSRDSSCLTAIPAAKFLNASIGQRRFVPTNVTNLRTATLLKYAIKNNRIVHFYSHPHNFISDPSLTNKLEYLLNEASRYRDQGRLKILTMDQWRKENE